MVNQRCVPLLPAMNVSHAHSAPTSGTLVDRPLFWLALLAMAHVAVRVAISPSLKWDEAEQILWSQSLQWGYGAQPPLYTWLQWALNAVLGPSVLSLSVLKHSALALTYVLMWGAAREVLGPRGAWWASASMLLLPPLGWSSVRDQTHSILVTAMTCAAWWLLIRLVKHSRPRDFALLGLVCALGMLSKYSYALVVVAMAAAALSVPESRRALLSRGWWWMPVVASLVLLPHLFWLANHFHEATSGTLDKMQIQPGMENASLGMGLRNLLGGLLSVVLLWAVVSLWAFRSAWWTQGATPSTPWLMQVFKRYFLLVVLCLLGMVLVAGVTHFRDRWILPLLCALPLMAFVARPDLQAHPRAARYTAAVAVIALLMLAAAGGRLWFGQFRGSPDELNHPIVELANVLKEAGYDGHSPIVAADHMLAGSLRTRFQQAPVRTCPAHKDDDVAACVKAAVDQARQAGRGWLLVSRSDRVEADWWTEAQSEVAPFARLGVKLPLHPPGKLPPAHYHFAWQPPEKRS